MVYLGYIFSIQIVAVAVGVVLALLIHPGDTLGSDLPQIDESTSFSDVTADFLRYEIMICRVLFIKSHLFSKYDFNQFQILNLVSRLLKTITDDLF